MTDTDIIPAADVVPSVAATLLENLTVADQAAFENRLASLLVPSWFGTGLTTIDDQTPQSDTPVMDTVLAGQAYPLAWIYVLYQYALTQSRLETMTGVWLDRFSYDFFGNDLQRRLGELDAQYRTRIQNEIFREKQTRAGIVQAVIDATGNTPQITEMWNPGDVGAYDVGVVEYAGGDVKGAGAYGDLSLNNQIFITVVRPSGGGIPEVASYDGGAGAYAADNPYSNLQMGLLGSGLWGMGFNTQYFGGRAEYISDSSATIQADDDAIYAAIADTVAAGITAWTAIQVAPDINAFPQLYFGSIGNTQNLVLFSSFF